MYAIRSYYDRQAQGAAQPRGAVQLAIKELLELAVVVESGQPVGAGELAGAEVQTRVVDAHGGDAAEDPQHAESVFRVGARLEVVEVEDSYNFV